MNAKMLIGTLSIFTCISCKQELQPQESFSDGATAPVAETSPQAPSVQQTQTMAPAAVTAPQTVPPPPPPVAKGMNPAHGQPGHRCDIPVGAPLNSPPAKPAAPTQKSTEPYTITPAKLNPDGSLSAAPASGAPSLLNPDNTTAPGMNPPHGQAGHRCDVAVGAPLPKSE